MYQNLISPTIVTKGCKILKLAINDFGLNFLDSIQYMPGSLEYLATYFRLPVKKGLFAHSLNKPCFYNLGNFFIIRAFLIKFISNFLKGPKMPSLNYFLQDQPPEKHEEIEDWYNERKLKPYFMKTELAIYCNLDTEILLLLMTNFLNQWSIIQREMRSYFIEKEKSAERKNELKDVFFHPFSSSFCTLSGFVYSLFRWYELNTYHISLVDDEKGSK